MQVHRLSDGFAQISKLFDLFKQFHNAPRFFDDQIGQLKVLGSSPMDNSCAAPVIPAKGFDFMG